MYSDVEWYIVRLGSFVIYFGKGSGLFAIRAILSGIDGVRDVEIMIRSCVFGRDLSFLFEKDGGGLATEPIAAIEAGDFQDEEEAHDFTLELLDEVGGSVGGTTCVLHMLVMAQWKG